MPLDDKICVTTSPLTGYEVYQWPEFQALAKRLGMADERRVVAFKIESSGPDDVVLVTVTRQAEDGEV